MAGVTNNLDSARASAGDRAVSRAYLREFWPTMIGYCVVLVAVVAWGHLDGDSGWRFLWAVLPVIPVLWTVRAVVRHVRRIDDYQRLLALQGMGTGFAVAMVAAVTVGFLSIAGLALPGAAWIIVGVGMLGWAVGSAVVMKR